MAFSESQKIELGVEFQSRVRVYLWLGFDSVHSQR